MIPSSYCRTSIFEEEFIFQYLRGDIYVQIATQNIVLKFLSKWHGKVNMDVSPNICNRNTFWTISLYTLAVHRQFQRQKFCDLICSRVKLKLKCWIKLAFFQWFWVIREIETPQKYLFLFRKFGLLICMHKNYYKV